MLTSSIQSEMIRADLYLENLTQDEPHLREDMLLVEMLAGIANRSNSG